MSTEINILDENCSTHHWILWLCVYMVILLCVIYYIVMYCIMWSYIMRSYIMSSYIMWSYKMWSYKLRSYIMRSCMMSSYIMGSSKCGPTTFIFKQQAVFTSMNEFLTALQRMISKAISGIYKTGHQICTSKDNKDNTNVCTLNICYFEVNHTCSLHYNQHRLRNTIDYQLMYVFLLRE